VKLLRYGSPGKEKPGVLDSLGFVRDLSAHVDDIAGEILLPVHLSRLQSLKIDDLPVVAGVPQVDFRLGSCVAQVGKCICIGLNYADHAAEAGLPLPKEPIVFNKWTSALSGPDDAIEIPKGSEKTDWEVELAVVIGQGGRYISENCAMSHVAGYCVFNDVSERDYQFNRGGSWDKGKGFDSFGPLGPWLVTADDITDPNKLDLWLEVDGKRYQNGNTSKMIFKVPFLISYLSQFMSLQPGDVIATGTPSGVGMGQNPSVFLGVGQTLHLSVEGLGTQTQVTVLA
jgi:2,4-diketo-3-deoxy-L-fuconate hydrolase